jgi:hypothetical protein
VRAGFLSILTACGGGGDPTCFVGSPGATPEIQLIHRTDDGFRVMSDGDAIPIVTPPQGGKVILPGVRARNLRCTVQITATLVDPCDAATISLESRPIVLAEGDDGWAVPADPVSLSSYANLQTCPRPGAGRDLEGEEYRLRIQVRDEEGRQAAAEMRVTPTCGEDFALVECQCECDRDYQLGQACEAEPDGGVPGCAPR